MEMVIPSPRVSALLIDAPVDRHFAQLHRDSEGLVAAVSLFIETGLRRGNGVIVLASAAHTEKFLGRLNGSGLDPGSYRRSGQLRMLDADAVLRRIIKSGMPDWTAFRQTVGSVLESVRAFGSTTRVYGELVNILWHASRPQAAIRLEEFWNELAKLYPFSLFCGYMLDSQNVDSYAGPLHDIGRTHSDIIATEEDERFRTALDQAARDVFGIPLSELIRLSDREQDPGEHRLPAAQKTMLWILKNMPTSSIAVLERARRYYEEQGPK